jgi:hypothetical protein
VDPPAGVICPHCGREVPRERFCVACGEHLADGGRGFAASPHERWWHPHVVSSIFPHLPRSDHRPFRYALVASVLAVVALCMLRFYPLALVAAAVSVPLLFVIYLWDVDVYEDEPLRVIAVTVGWGALAGAGLGIASRGVASAASLLQGKPTTHELVWLGIVLPLAALALMLAGPLMLLPYRKFDDCLDGAVFGATCASTLLAAEAIANSASFLQLGLRAAGDQSLWVPRLLTLGVTMPVLAAGVAGATCAAFWLRLRSPVRDRRALGVLGSPPVAVLVAAAALVGASVAELYLGHWTVLTLTAALAVLALVWLRWTLQLGLRQQAEDRAVGSPIECPSCGHQTPLHTFCGNCGVALHALPKQGAPHSQRPPRRARLRPGVKLAVFGALAAGAVGIAAIVIATTRPSSTSPECKPGVPCASPPLTPIALPHVASAVFQSGVPWTSDLGPGLHYPKGFKVVTSSKRSLVVKGESSSGLFVIIGVYVVPSSRTPAQAMRAQLSSEQGGLFLGVDADNSAKHVILSPEIGYTHGIAAMYHATVDQPPSPSEQVEIAFMAARQGAATVVVEGITNQGDQTGSGSSPFPALGAVDSILSSFTWGVPPT